MVEFTTILTSPYIHILCHVFLLGPNIKIEPTSIVIVGILLVGSHAKLSTNSHLMKAPFFLILEYECDMCPKEYSKHICIFVKWDEIELQNYLRILRIVWWVPRSSKNWKISINYIKIRWFKSKKVSGLINVHLTTSNKLGWVCENRLKIPHFQLPQKGMLYKLLLPKC